MSAQSTNTASANNPYAPNPKTRTTGTANTINVPKVIFEPSVLVSNEVQVAYVDSVNDRIEPTDTAVRVESATANRYSIGPSDILEIYIKGQSLKQRFYTVSEDGTVDFELAGGKVFVASKTAAEVEREIKARSVLLTNADVRVVLKERSSHSVEVTGSVALSGVVHLQRDAVPLFVINASVLPNAEAKQVKLIRRENGNISEQIFDLQQNSEMMIRPNDRLEYVTELGLSITGYYYISGRAATKGKHDLTGAVTLASIVVTASLPKDAAKRVRLRTRLSDGTLKDAEYEIKLLRNGKIADVQVTHGSIVEFID